MRTLTAVTPAMPTLPPELALLLAPIRFAGAASVAEGYAGHAQGVILDDEGVVIAFVVRLSPKLATGSPRTLVSASAMTVTDDSMLLLEWPQDRLLAQQRLEDDPQGKQGSAPAGGGVLGVLSGGSQDGPMKTGRDDTAPEHHNPSLRALERELRNPALSTLGLVSTTRFSPLTAPEAPVQHQSSGA